MEYYLPILKNDKILVTLTLEGYISEVFSGRFVLKLANYENKTIKFSWGTDVAYNIANTFSLNKFSGTF